ncbi:MAG TPA: hypothetical protein VFY14_20255 [Streptomyces sp.]|nr:hypothetical protein [Streptomyces sp.]
MKRPAAQGAAAKALSDQTRRHMGAAKAAARKAEEARQARAELERRNGGRK